MSHECCITQRQPLNRQITLLIKHTALGNSMETLHCLGTILGIIRQMTQLGEVVCI